VVNITKLLKLEKKLILASASPRRHKLLKQLGFDFEVIVSNIDETNHSDLSPESHVKVLAFEKARHVANGIKEPAIVLGSDTIVVLDGEVLNKPIDEQDAKRILKKLSGRTHKVFTGIALIDLPSNKYQTEYQETEVTFRSLTEEEISAYISTGSPMDKAGAYGIQDDFGAVFVSKVNGCYYNIVGLPLEMLYSSLKSFINSNSEI
jgi:septum formation protein